MYLAKVTYLAKVIDVRGDGDVPGEGDVAGEDGLSIAGAVRVVPGERGRGVAVEGGHREPRARHLNITHKHNISDVTCDKKGRCR